MTFWVDENLHEITGLLLLANVLPFQVLEKQKIGHYIATLIIAYAFLKENNRYKIEK